MIRSISCSRRPTAVINASFAGPEFWMFGSVAPVSKSLRDCRAFSTTAGQGDLLGQAFCVDSVLIHFAQCQDQLEIDGDRRCVQFFRLGLVWKIT